MLLHEKLDRLVKRTPADEFIPVLAWDQDTGVFLCNDGYLGVCYYGPPMIGADDTTSEMLRGAFSMPVPDGSFVQISLIGMPNVRAYLDRYLLRRENDLNYIRGEDTKRTLYNYYNRRIEFIDNGRYRPLIPATGVKVIDRQVILTLKMPYKGMTPSEEEIDLIAETGSKLAESLQAAGLFLRRMSATQYMRFARLLLDPYSEEEFTEVSDYAPIRSQIMRPGETLDVRKNYLLINDHTYVKALSVSRWPKRNALSLMAYAIGDPLGANNQIKTPYHICLTIHYPNQFKKVNDMKRKSALINYQAFGPMMRFVPKLALKKEGMDVLINAIEQGAVVCEASLNFLFYSDDLDEVERQASGTKTYLQSFDLNMGEETRLMLPVFWNAFPLFPTQESIRNTFRFSSMGIEHALTFAPVLGEWKGTSRVEGFDNKGFALLLTSRRGQIMGIDLYDSPTNYNGIIFAESGAGKSFFTQQIIMDYLSIGAKVWVIDVGRSYYKLSKALKGTFMEFSEDSKICLNPFTHVVDIDEDVFLLQTLIEKMAAPEQGLDDYRRSRIEESIKAIWGRLGNAATITDVADYMSNQPDSRITDVGSQLFTFTRYGSLGHWFDGENNLDLDKDLIVLEMEELRNKKTLQQVVLMQLITSIQREMFLSRDQRPKVLIIDEAWDLLDDPIVGRFLEHAYRRFRKYNGAAIVVTQSIADLYKSPSGAAIASNSAFKFILRQNAEAISYIQKNEFLAVGEYGFDLMRSIHSVPGRYSEIMIYGPNGALGVSRLVVDRFSQVLFSTSPEERNAIISAVEAGKDVTEAINEYIAEKG